MRGNRRTWLSTRTADTTCAHRQWSMRRVSDAPQRQNHTATKRKHSQPAATRRAAVDAQHKNSTTIQSKGPRQHTSTQSRTTRTPYTARVRRQCTQRGRRFAHVVARNAAATGERTHLLCGGARRQHHTHRRHHCARGKGVHWKVLDFSQREKRKIISTQTANSAANPQSRK